MIDTNITFHSNLERQEYRFSILIPSWNNLEYLKLCVRSIQENSKDAQDFQIIVIVNEGNDKTIDWLTEEKICDFVHSPTNIGICYALNIARKLVKSPYIIYINDDMYVTPNWDEAINREINLCPDNLFYFSATMIEPYNTGNSCVSVHNYGDCIENFQEAKLLRNYSTHIKNDWNGATWPPSIVPTQLWDAVGGLSTEYSPGMYSDPDFSRKLYEAGIRNFKGIGDSLVYHFGSKSTKRIRKNIGRIQYLNKWGNTSGYFNKKILNLGKPYAILPASYEEKRSSKLINRLKKLKGIFSSFF